MSPQELTALVTGATGAIGHAIAVEIARHAHYRVVLLCRDQQKAVLAVRSVADASGNSSVGCELVDLSSKKSIASLARRLRDPVHVLVNNAAETSRRRQETAAGIELQFATNVLGYFWMINAFSDHLKAADTSRVVNVASYWAGDLELDDLEFKRRRYNNSAAYRQSKQADRMLTVAFADRLSAQGTAVNACHPGDVDSRLSNNLGFGGHESPQQAACTPAWLATDPVGRRESGMYFENRKMRSCPFARDPAAITALYEACDDY